MVRHVSESARLTILVLLVPLALACSSIKVTSRDEYDGARLARPDRIVVHDFAADPDDLPSWSEAARTHAGAHAKVSPNEAAAERSLGIAMAERVVERIDRMGLDATRASESDPPRPGDIVIVGYLASVDQGSGIKRIVVGFGSGAAEVTSHVEGYLVTDEGMQKIGSGDARSGKGRSPGMIVPLAVTVATANPIGLLLTAPFKVGGEVTGRSKLEGVGKRMADKIADELQEKFREQEWIKG